jgi:acyl-CoA dehydrogenase
MDFTVSDNAREVLALVRDFFDREILPRNREMIRAIRLHGDFDPPFLAELRRQARELGLWNMAMTSLDAGYEGTPLSNSDYAPVAEHLGRILWASKVFNCQWPDVPNMTALQKCATAEQKQRWLKPLIDGECHSAFAMTEPGVASSDATNIATRIRRDGDEYVIDGDKWYITGAGHPNCRFYMLLGCSDPEAQRNRQHSVVMVPRDAPGVTVGPPNSFFGFVEPNGPATRVSFRNVRVPVENRIGDEGDGFKVTQARLAPARLHHAMRAVGQGELLIEMMMVRAHERDTFGRPVAQYDTVQYAIAQSRVDVEQMRLLCQKAAWRVDEVGDADAFRDLAVLKVGVAQAYHRIAERAVQIFGAMAGHEGTPVADAYAWSRAFRIGDGPDEVHLRSIYRREAKPEGGLAASPYFEPLEED